MKRISAGIILQRQNEGGWLGHISQTTTVQELLYFEVNKMTGGADSEVFWLCDLS